MAYEKKLVAFVDLLGFKEVSSNTNEKNATHNILSTNHQIVDILQNVTDNKNQRNNDDNDFVIQTFSDSIFFAYPEDELYKLLYDLSTISFSIAERGFFLRGGVAFGDIYARNNENYFYGPALIAAHHAESKTAVYPRIIMDISAMDLINSIDLEHRIYQDNLLIKDFDEETFINFLTTSNINSNCDSISTIKKCISNKLKENFKKPSVLLKYIWLLNYFNNYVASNKQKHIILNLPQKNLIDQILN